MGLKNLFQISIKKLFRCIINQILRGFLHNEGTPDV